MEEGDLTADLRVCRELFLHRRRQLFLCPDGGRERGGKVTEGEGKWVKKMNNGSKKRAKKWQKRAKNHDLRAGPFLADFLFGKRLFGGVSLQHRSSEKAAKATLQK